MLENKYSSAFVVPSDNALYLVIKWVARVARWLVRLFTLSLLSFLSERST